MINYKLAKEIGATHHIDNLLYKFSDEGFAMCYFSEYGWEKTENDAAQMAELRRIDFDKLKPRTEYEKATDYFFDLRDEFERGELYFDRDRCTGGIYASSDQYQKIRDMIDFNQAALNNNIYRKVEKEIDWRDEVHEYLGGTDFHWSTPIAEVVNDEPDYFLELCRVALRANGEIE